LATAPTAPLPAPAKVAAANVEVPLAVNIPSCNPLALTAEVSEPPEVVGLENPPLLVIDRVPVIVAFPDT
jgi:hypothetical protein